MNAKPPRRASLTLSPAYDPPISQSYWERWRAALPTAHAPRVVIHGGYGKRNLGDDAILQVLLEQIRGGIPNAEISVLCHGPELVSKAHGVAAYHFSGMEALRAILAADLYVIGGGGIINRINTYSGLRRLRVLDPKGKFVFLAPLLAKARGARVVFHAIGATSVPDPLVGWLARWSISAANEVSVRDPLSREVLGRLGVRREIRVVPDPALSLEAIPPHDAQELLVREGLDPEMRLVGLNLRPVVEPDIRNEEIALAVARLVDWLVAELGGVACFLPFGRHPVKWAEDDRVMGRQIAEHVTRQDRFHLLEGEYTPAQMKGILGQMSFCVLERLHAAILAASAGVPFVAISYDAKVSQFMEAIGGSERVIPLRDVASRGQGVIEAMLDTRMRA